MAAKISFEIQLAVTHFIGFTTLLLNGYFFNTYSELAWPSKTKNGVNLHGFFMVVAFIFLQGEALLAYRVHRESTKLFAKFIHVILHIAAIAFGVVALIAIIINKNNKGYNHFYSVHSWIGIGLIAGYIIHFSFGFLSFLCPCTPGTFRARFLPIHRIIGATCLGLAVVQCALGYVTLLESAPSCFSKLSCKDGMEYIASFGLISIIVYSVLVLTIITPAAWRRQKTPDELK